MKPLRMELLLGDAAKVIKAVPDDSIHLIPTSCPYWGVEMWGDMNEKLLGIKNSWWIDEDIKKLKKCERIFNDYLAKVWAECFRILVPGGRLIINVADTPSKLIGYWNNHLEIMNRCKKVGFLHRDNIYWWKGHQHKVSGSFPRPWGILIANTVEYVIVLQKPGVRSYKRMSKKRIQRSLLPEGSEEWVLNPVWCIKSASARKEKHIAPFPLELVKRLIMLYTYRRDTVLDPFLGSGTTMKAAKLLNRHCIGIEIYEKYFKQISRKVGWNAQTLENFTNAIQYKLRKFKSRIR